MVAGLRCGYYKNKCAEQALGLCGPVWHPGVGVRLLLSNQLLGSNKAGNGQLLTSGARCGLSSEWKVQASSRASRLGVGWGVRRGSRAEGK